MIKKFTFQRKIPLLLCLIVWVGIPFKNQAQSVKRQCVSSYGAITATGNVALMQTVGQPYNTTVYSGNSTAITQGFQQPLSFKVETVNSGPMKNLALTVFPNPAAYSVTIESDVLIENSTIEVTDLTGKIILSEQVTQFQTYDISCGQWENGIYLITVSDNNQKISSIKVTINK